MGYEALGGVPEYRRGRKLLDFARRISDELHNPYTTALIYGFWAFLDLQCGRIEEGLEHCRNAAVVLREAGSGLAWETVTYNLLLIWFLGWGGRVHELSEIVRQILEDARSRGDVYADVTIRCFTTAHLVDLAADNPEKAVEEIAGALLRWPKKHYDLQHFGATFACVECHLYAGRIQEARQLMAAEWRRIQSSLLFRKCQYLRITLLYMRGRIALAEWLGRRTDKSVSIEAEQQASRLAKIESPWGEALSHMLRAGLCAGRRQTADAIVLLEGAEAALRQQDLRLLAAAVRRRRGELEGDKGYALIATADAFMRAEGIIRPDRMSGMILPGDWR